MKFRLVHIIYFIIVFLFISSLYVNIQLMLEFYKITGNDFSWHTFSNVNYFSFQFFLILPLIGLFLKNKYGWLFISSYFYMLFLNGIILMNREGWGDIESVIIFIALELIIALIFVLMNLDKISFNCYNILKKELLGMNLISFVIGSCLSILMFISRNEHYFN